MNITTEQLQSLYRKTMEYCQARYGSAPDKIMIDDNGNLIARFEEYSRYGDYDYSDKYILPESLSDNLEELYNKRKEEEEKARIEAKKEERKRQRIYDAQQKEQRKQQYLKLKKEFES